RGNPVVAPARVTDPRHHLPGGVRHRVVLVPGDGNGFGCPPRHRRVEVADTRGIGNGQVLPHDRSGRRGFAHDCLRGESTGPPRGLPRGRLPPETRMPATTTRKKPSRKTASTRGPANPRRSAARGKELVLNRISS